MLLMIFLLAAVAIVIIAINRSRRKPENVQALCERLAKRTDRAVGEVYDQLNDEDV